MQTLKFLQVHFAKIGEPKKYEPAEANTSAGFAEYQRAVERLGK